LNSKYPGSSVSNPADLNALIQNYKNENNSYVNQPVSKENSGIETTGLKKEDIKSDDSLDESSYQKLLKGEIIDPEKLVSSLTVFGHTIFEHSKPSTFAPTDNTPVPADYTISTDDEIIIMLWGRINEEYKLKVQKDGSITIPRLGPVSVSGIKFETMKKNLIDQLSKIEGVNVNVSMGVMRTIGVYIVGEVNAPGFYTVSALSNVTNALFYAGGPTKNGSLRNIQLKRNGTLVSKLDFYDFLLSGNDNSSLRLQSGDVIFVPIVTNMAAIAGNVRRSAIYELSSNSTLKSVIELAGGFTAAAWTNKIQISRFKNNQYHIVLDLDSISTNFPNFSINDGDLIKVFPVLSKDANAVYLSGNVTRPGKYEYKNGMKIHDIIPDYQNLLSESYFDYAVIFRQEPPSFLNRIIAFNLKNIIENPESDDNIYLKPKDQIMVYNRDFFEPVRNITIDGAVTKAGNYKLMENMKIRDLILQAGGLKDEASPIRGEVYRRHSLRNEKIKTEKIDFCISCAMENDPQHNLLLYKSDVVYIRSKMGWEKQRIITLEGQFIYPGKYVLFEGENLGDLIGRAGGFKDDAYIAAAVFTRKSVKDLEYKRMEEYQKNLESEIMKLSIEKAAKEDSDVNTILSQKMLLKDETENTDLLGRVVIDLSNPANFNDFSLEDGDSLYIPRNLNTISVIGEVFNPTTFKYQPEYHTVQVCVESAGGLKASADKKNIYVVKANGNILTKKGKDIDDYILSPGDAVVVPQKIDYSNANKRFSETITNISAISATVFTVISTISLIYKLNE
jgi:protein involved in polysaccharide export with SLBB domain